MNMASLPPDWTELMPELEAAETDVRLTKRAYGAFLGAGLEMPLDAELRSRGVTQIVLAGISTSVGVESTARSAYDLGYNVVFVTDAMTDRDPEAHRFTVEKIFPRLGERASTAEVLEKLQR